MGIQGLPIFLELVLSRLDLIAAHKIRIPAIEEVAFHGGGGQSGSPVALRAVRSFDPVDENVLRGADAALPLQMRPHTDQPRQQILVLRQLLSDTLDVVISDTVGFIRKLPHQLVEAFKATLEELEYADLLLHVIDLSNPQWPQQAQVVDSLIRELKADHIPCLRVYNKCDLAFSGRLPREEDSVYISAKTGEGVDAWCDWLRCQVNEWQA
mgnify:CR=1 FL=1